jgi:tetratricopeptide (TPR) repeat protein
MTDIFEIQDEIAQAIVGKLRIRLPGGAPRAKRYTENLEAYNQYLKARYLNHNRTAETLVRGAELLRQALTIDPDYPLAHLGLAEHYTIAAHQGLKMPRELLPKAKAALVRALELDTTLAEAHALLGHIQTCFEYDWVGGEHELKYALTLEPRSSYCLYRYAFSIRGLGHRLDEALALARRAQDLEPRSVLVNWLPALLLFFQKQYGKALEECLLVIECAPSNIAYVVLAEIYAVTEMADEAVAAGEKVTELDARSPFSLGVLGFVCGRVGRADKARALLAELDDIESRTYVPAEARAWIHGSLGEHDDAFRFLNKAIDEGSPLMPELAVNPLAERFRSDPRYKMVLKRMNLA